MTSLVVYDSIYGNTEKIAETIATIFDSMAITVDTIQNDDIQGLKLLVVGSPTQGGRPTPRLQGWLNSLPPQALKGVKIAAFDTRLDADKQNVWLQVLMHIIQYAAPKITKSLERAGGQAVTSPKGFIVDGQEGPLGAGQLRAAKIWARTIQKAMQ